MNNVCEFCNSNESELYIKSDLVSYNKCLNCGLIYQFPVITQKEIDAIYDDNYFEYEIANQENFFKLIRLALKDIEFENIKKEFFESYAISPILIWNGRNGAFKLEDGFPPENIPLFIAVNTKINWTNSIISFLYKDKTEGIIRFYNNFYTNENNKIIRIEVSKESLSYRYNYAQRILSEDILRGKKYFNDLK